ncbi:MAG: type IV toxin-antitoxin system AbiEi family antitoxin domain-containing protein [Prevotella sp.]|nr:type IV toxin-antitoxin system AbiEi family antitoxin domain-containing protein [Prevotella sp.]
MNTNNDIVDSVLYRVMEYLKTNKRGTILTIKDFMNIERLSYTHIRSILVHLCKRGILIRVSRGVYCYPKYDGNKPIYPPVITILKAIAHKEGYEICPISEYAQYLMGIKNTIPLNIVCYNNQRIKTVNLTNGISIKILPSKKAFSSFVGSFGLRMLLNYINSNGINNIPISDKRKLINYFNSLDSNSKMAAKKLPSEIITFLELQ